MTSGANPLPPYLVVRMAVSSELSGMIIIRNTRMDGVLDEAAMVASEAQYLDGLVAALAALKGGA